MDIVRHPATTRTLGAPAKWDHTAAQCDALPIIDHMEGGQPWMVSFWRPSADELKALNSGGVVSLWVNGTEEKAHPVVGVGVDIGSIEAGTC